MRMPKTQNPKTRSPRETISIRKAIEGDRQFVIKQMNDALSPYYGGDHRAHATRIFSTHLSGGIDKIGYFSFEQRMFIITVDRKRAGLVHVVGKRQGTFKISPIIVAPKFRGGSRRIGERLLSHAERYAKKRKARQIYCTVTKTNSAALKFFLKQRYVIAGMSDSHYKPNLTEVMLYKQFYSDKEYQAFDRVNVSVRRCAPQHEAEVRTLLLQQLPGDFHGIDDGWVDALFAGYYRQESKDVNLKYKLVYLALDREDRVIGVAGATPKKGEPIKIMPFIAKSLPAFVALLSDVPYELRDHGRKLYIHIMPTAYQAVAMQQSGWHLDAALPGAYHKNKVMQQWSLDLSGENVMRLMRVKQHFLDLIRSGRKTLEVRVGYQSIKSIRPEDRIRLASRDQTEVIVVKDIRNYASFDEMATKEDLGKIAPGSSPSSTLHLLKQLYPDHKESLGVVVLEITLDQ
jgi:ASC-1-like (ASCH) protein/ribosomal protein S18 acetylase RimI-like enzyme